MAITFFLKIAPILGDIGRRTEAQHLVHSLRIFQHRFFQSTLHGIADSTAAAEISMNEKMTVVKGRQKIVETPC